MALTKFTDNVEVIQALSNTPNATEGLTADQLKAKFDESSGKTQTYINDVLTSEIDSKISDIEDGIEALDTSKVNKTDVVNGFASTSTTNPGSAKNDKDLKDMIDGGTLKSKIITITRDGQGNSGDVSYTGVGFTPTSLKAIMSMSGTLYQSNGFSDSSKNSSCIYQSSANLFYNNGGSLIVYSNQSAWVQSAIVKSYDVDGFTLTWNKVGTPVAGTMTIYIICEK